MDIYESIIKNTDLLFFIINPDGIIIDTNKYTTDLFDDTDLTGKYFYTLVDSGSEVSIKAVLFYGESSSSMESIFKMKFGPAQPAYINISAINNFLIITGFLKGPHNMGIIRSDDVMISSVKNEMEEYESKRAWQVKNIDPLTGLYNKDFLKYIFEIQYNKALKSGGNIGIICFKINDLNDMIKTYGEDKANRLMVGFSQIMLTSTRSTDYSIKYDDKFILILTNANREILKKVSDRIINAANKNLGVSISSGLACTIDSNIEDKWDLIKLAYEDIETKELY